jgi:hypothetical protein
MTLGTGDQETETQVVFPKMYPNENGGFKCTHEAYFLTALRMPRAMAAITTTNASSFPIRH